MKNEHTPSADRGLSHKFTSPMPGDSQVPACWDQNPASKQFFREQGRQSQGVPPFQDAQGIRREVIPALFKYKTRPGQPFFPYFRSVRMRMARNAVEKATVSPAQTW